MKKFNKIIFASTLLFGFSAAQAGILVVAHPSVEDTALTSNVAANIFLGKTKSLPSGKKMVPIDQDKGEAARDEFYTKVTNKNTSQLSAYWARRIFTGKGQPPTAVFDDEEVLEMISANPNMIGYVSDTADTSGVKVLLTTP